MKSTHNRKTVLRLAILFSGLMCGLLGGPIAMAQEILYRNPGQSADEFSSLKLARPEAKSYDELLAERIVSREMKEQLIAAFVSAQEHFLKSEISRIQTEWQDVTSFAYKADWGPAQREMIQTAYMRLSQIASTPESTKKYLRAAYEFSPSYEPDDKLFPPPLVEQYQELRKSRVVQTLSMKNFSGFSILYVNGVRTDIESTDAIEIAAGPKRMTLLSPMYTPVTRVLDAESLLTFNPDRSHLPQALKSQGPRLAANDLAPKPNLDIGPDFTLTGARSRESKPFYQKPRFWVITAAVAGAVLVYNSQKDKGEESHSPTHTQGL